MTSKNKSLRIVEFAALLLVSFVNGGCTLDQITRIFPGGVPNVKGTWVGRLESAKVFNDAGQSFDAAELHIEKGPAPKEDYPGELKKSPGDGRVPVLATWEDAHNSYLVIDPSTLPIGHRVNVSGVLFRYPLFRIPGGAVSRQMYLGWDRGGEEQILYVEGSIKVID